MQSTYHLGRHHFHWAERSQCYEDFGHHQVDDRVDDPDDDRGCDHDGFRGGGHGCADDHDDASG